MHPIDYEPLVIAAWREAFGVEVQSDDDFFELGGDSLRALYIVNELSETMRAPEELVAALLTGVFENVTPGSFATFLRSLPLEALDDRRASR